ncbi:hypothetical protein BGZ63DRAFT_375583 [Mariannaea sp. PMI_226]|nr:hypothetical protein BGZ63DRAFT_375583 [Mariannaea sp. PMI_226]
MRPPWTCRPIRLISPGAVSFLVSKAQISRKVWQPYFGTDYLVRTAQYHSPFTGYPVSRPSLTPVDNNCSQLWIVIGQA